MAGLANGGSVVEFVAIDTHTHRRDARDLGHCSHIGDLTVARFALYTRFQVLAMRPVDSCRERVDAHPRDRPFRFCQGCKFLNRWFFCRNGGVAGHTGACRRESHQFPRLRICVAGAALQADCQMQLVAVRDRLRGRGLLGHVVGHVFFCARSCRRLLCFHAKRSEDHGGEQDCWRECC